MSISNLFIWEPIACIASVFVGLGSKERSRNGILPAQNWGESGNSLPLNPTKTLATHARELTPDPTVLAEQWQVEVALLCL